MVQRKKRCLRRQGGGTLKPYGECMEAAIIQALSGHSRDVRYVATVFAGEAHFILLETR